MQGRMVLLLTLSMLITLVLCVIFNIRINRNLKFFTSKYDQPELVSESNYITIDKVLGRTYRNLLDNSTYTKLNACFSENLNQSQIYFKENNPHWHAVIICAFSDVLNVGLIRKIAWLNTRPNLPDTRCLRLHVILNDDLNITYGENSTSVYQTGVYRMSAIFGHEFNVELSKYGVYALSGCQRSVEGVRYKEYSLVYILPKDQLLSELGDTVTLQLLWPNSISTLSFEIKVGKSAQQNTASVNHQGFFVCVNALYGQFPKEDESFFIEWVEFLQILGVDEIHLYNASWQVSNHMRNILDFYNSKGVVYTHQFENPFLRHGKPDDSDTYPYDTVGLLQRSSTNTCFYANKDRFKFMIAIDLDEIIVPFTNNTYHELLDWLSKVHNQNLSNIRNIISNWGHYYTFFHKTDNSSMLRTMQYREYTHNFVRRKAFINTGMCMYGYAHGCTHPKQIENKLDMNVEFAETNHYRKTCKRKCDALDKTKINNHILRFSDKLEQNVKRSIETIGQRQA